MLSKFSRPRAILSEAQAIDIFKIKLAANTSMRACPSPVQIAALFGVSEKTVRDIWKGRTWAKQTYRLDSTRQVPIKQRCCRPRGSKGSRPRADLKHCNLDLLPDVEQDYFLDINITSTDDCTVTCSRQQCHDGKTRLQVNADSLDYQLHEWTEGTSTPTELVDPFLLDWMGWAASTDGKNED
jgi:hypothetical protein